MSDHDKSAAVPDDDYEDGPQYGLIDVLTWLGDSKGLVALLTAVGMAVGLACAFLLPEQFTARTTLLPPGTQQSNSSAALATLGAIGALPAGLAPKTPDELYVTLLRSDTVLRRLDEAFGLQARYKVANYERLRRKAPTYIDITADKKTGVITVAVTDEQAEFAAKLANAHASELATVLSRLAVSEAQQRRVFFEQQLKATKDRLVAAEQDLRKVQERSGVIVLDKQAEALITGAAQLRALIAEREVQLRVLRTGATEQNPEVMRMNSELAGLRAELSRLESSRPASGSAPRDASSPLDLPVGKLPEAAIDYIRARRELKVQETLLENMIRQYEIAKLDEAKEGQVLQQIDTAVPPDYRSYPPRLYLVAGGTAGGLLLAVALVVLRRSRELDDGDGTQAASWRALARAWSFRG
jgi:uncharacterized protein involved in exopolysaccharide biosynthesis